jgi:flagellar biosynthesis protein FliQ
MNTFRAPSDLLAMAISIAFIVIALWHFYMAFFPPRGDNAAVPSVNGKPLFVPSLVATLGVGAVVTAFAALTAATADLLPMSLPKAMLVWLSYGLAVGLFLRAIGEFKYVGFFKRVRSSRFAKFDTFIYSPLCLLLAMGVACNALRHRA